MRLIKFKFQLRNSISLWHLFFQSMPRVIEYKHLLKTDILFTKNLGKHFQLSIKKEQHFYVLTSTDNEFFNIFKSLLFLFPFEASLLLFLSSSFFFICYREKQNENVLFHKDKDVFDCRIFTLDAFIRL